MSLSFVFCFLDTLVVSVRCTLSTSLRDQALSLHNGPLQYDQVSCSVYMKLQPQKSAVNLPKGQMFNHFAILIICIENFVVQAFLLQLHKIQINTNLRLLLV